MSATTHPRPLTHNLHTNKVYCAGCLASADTVQALDAKPCMSAYFD